MAVVEAGEKVLTAPVAVGKAAAGEALGKGFTADIFHNITRVRKADLFDLFLESDAVEVVLLGVNFG